MHALESLITWCITVLECDLEIWFIVEKTINFSASKNTVLLRLLLCYCFFSVILVCRFIMRNAAIIYFFFFGILLFTEWFRWVLHLSLVTVFIRYLVFLFSQQKFSIKKLFVKVEKILTLLSLAFIHQYRENNPLFSYYFKTSKW